MASNTFGSIFKITTWGESHGKAVGVVIDGCPAGLEISEEDICAELARRAPGKNMYVSPRKETDTAQILSGVFEGKTTGAPISILIPNLDAESSKYESLKHLLRPGHANYTYLQKYGIFDYRGGGRASARETACRVAAGAIAKKLLLQRHIIIVAYIKQIGSLVASIDSYDGQEIISLVQSSPIFCPDANTASTMMALIETVKKEGDSIGGVVEFAAFNIMPGLGDPVYEKLEAKLAYAMMSLPASKGFEIGSGFGSSIMKGSEHNDRFINIDGKIVTKTNFSGGILGGISNGMTLIGRIAFKPTSSIAQTQDTLTVSGESTLCHLPSGSRHDSCVAIRAVPVVEAMVALVLIDALLMNQLAQV